MFAESNKNFLLDKIVLDYGYEKAGGLLPLIMVFHFDRLEEMDLHQPYQ